MNYLQNKIQCKRYTCIHSKCSYMHAGNRSVMLYIIMCDMVSYMCSNRFRVTWPKRIDKGNVSTTISNVTQQSHVTWTEVRAMMHSTCADPEIVSMGVGSEAYFCFFYYDEDECTVSLNICPKIFKLFKSHENAYIPLWIRVYIHIFQCLCLW